MLMTRASLARCGTIEEVLETKDEDESDRMTDETSRLPKPRLQPNSQVFCCDERVSLEMNLMNITEMDLSIIDFVMTADGCLTYRMNQRRKKEERKKAKSRTSDSNLLLNRRA